MDEYDFQLKYPKGYGLLFDFKSFFFLKVEFFNGHLQFKREILPDSVRSWNLDFFIFDISVGFGYDINRIFQGTIASHQFDLIPIVYLGLGGIQYTDNIVFYNYTSLLRDSFIKNVPNVNLDFSLRGKFFNILMLEPGFGFNFRKFETKIDPQPDGTAGSVDFFFNVGLFFSM